MVTTKTLSRSNSALMGASASTNPMAEQLALVAINPPDCFRQLCCSISAMWSALTSGMTRGTSSFMRNAEEFEMTAQPAAANLGSNSAATAASSAEKTILVAPAGSAGATIICATSAGSGILRRQRAASAYAFPADRSEAATQPTRNHG